MKLKRILIASALAAAAAVSTAPAHAVQVGVSLGFAAPGAYGRVDIGRFPGPALVYRRPVVVGAPLAVRDPVYLWVPYEHRVRWDEYCASYGACGLQVYFVDDGWYRDHVIRYAPRPVVYDGYYGGYPGGYYRGGYGGYGGYYGGGYYGGYYGGRPYYPHDRDDWRDRDDRWHHDRDGDHDRYHDHDGDHHDHDGDHHDHDGDPSGGDRWQRGGGRGY